MAPDQLNALGIAIVILCAYRVTRLIVSDTWIGHPATKDSEPTDLRLVLDRWAYDEQGDDRSWLRGKVGDGLTCVFCVGVWVSVATLWAWVSGPDWLRWCVLAGAVAGGQAFVSSRFNS